MKNSPIEAFSRHSTTLGIERNDSVDLLRGLAILGVVTVHCIGVFPTHVAPLDSILKLGRYGVQLFFVASAFTLLMMWERRALTDAQPVLAFFVRRVARIIPMFWIASIFYLLINGTGPSYFAPSGIGALEIGLTLLTLHGWWPSAFNSVVPGGWSIAVEMTFYAMFPFLAVRLRGLNSILLTIFISSTSALLAQTVLRNFLSSFLAAWPSELIDIFWKFFFLRQIVFFLAGIAVYKWVVGGERFRLDLKTLALAVASAWFTYASLGRGDFLVAVTLSVLAGTVLSRNFSVPLLGMLGRYSYSIYLVHFIVLRVLTAPIDSLSFDPALRSLIGLLSVLLSSLLVAFVTKRIVEDPGIAFGRNLLSQKAHRAGVLS
jgi:exopolysaccharide production protein ExoZ